MHKIKLLFCIDGLRNGGKERQLLELMKGLANSEFQCGVVTFNPQQFYAAQVKQLTDHFWEIDKTTKLKPFWQLKKIFQQFNPALVHSWDSLSSFYCYPLIKRKKLIFIEGSIRDTGVDKGWHYYFKRFFLTRANEVISNSKLGLEAYRVAGRVIYNAIDPQRFLPQQPNPQFNIIKTANFTDFKDHTTFMRAAIDLINKNIIDLAYLAGSGPHLAACRKLAEAQTDSIRDRIIFLGNVAHIEPYLQQCRIGVLCSTKKYGEGISNAILEYMAGGLVPVATDIGATSEIIRHHYNGCLFPAEDSQRLTELITALKNNPELFQSLTKQAAYTIQQQFNYQKNIERFIDIYHSCL
jgi:glycosyltransferase involved in cell wall biosynthesis